MITSMVALVTPMHPNGDLDYKALEKLVEFQLENQTDGLIILGTTGESPTIDSEEHTEVVQRVIAQVARQVPVISGVGSNSTKKTIERAKLDTQLGVDGLLIVTPYYNKPTQEGLYQHFKAISQAVDNKIILYNAPGRTAVDLLPETVARLATLSNIVAIKDCVSPERVRALRAVLTEHFLIYCGEDECNFEFLEAGAQGFISVTANLAAKQLHEMSHAFMQGDKGKAEAIHRQLMPLHKNLFIQTNPIPVKFVLHELGLINHGIRLPLTWLDETYQAKVRTAIQEAKI